MASSSFACGALAGAGAVLLVSHLLRKRSRSRLLPGVTDLLNAFVEECQEPGAASLKHLASPEQIAEAFTSAGCAISLEDGRAHDDATLLRAVQVLLDYSVRSGSPLFFNQLYGRVETPALAGEMVSAALNAACHTYEVAPVLTVIERHMLARVAAAVGPKFGACWDGLFVPGGSIGNLYAIHLARHRTAPSCNEVGAVGGPRLVGFVSEESHYSYLKSARLIGLGSRSLVAVKVDEASGGMDVEALRRAIAEARAAGGVPFFVGATAGTTVRGAFDPLDELAAVCASEGLWLHVDAAWGGGALFSAAHRHHLRGADDAHSFSMSAHKLLGAGNQCAVFLVRDTAALTAANAARATYLFQPDKLNAALDTGDKTIQCGRKADMLKLWVLFKSLGDGGIDQRMAHNFALAAHAARRVRQSAGALVLAFEPSCTNVCFYVVPAALRPLPPPESLTPAHAIHAVAPHVKAGLQAEGGALIGFQTHAGRPNFFRWVFASCYNVTTAHVDAILDRMGSLAETAALPPAATE